MGHEELRGNKRRGRWIVEEEEFARGCIDAFCSGMLAHVQEGTTLRAYLSDQLQCHPMRVTKKLHGSKGMGKRLYRRAKASTPAMMDATAKALEALEVRLATKLVAISDNARVPARYIAAVNAAPALAPQVAGCQRQAEPSSSRAQLRQPSSKLEQVTDVSSDGRQGGGGGGGGSNGAAALRMNAKMVVKPTVAQVSQHRRHLMESGRPAGSSTSASSGGGNVAEGACNVDAAPAPAPTPAATSVSGSRWTESSSGKGRGHTREVKPLLRRRGVITSEVPLKTHAGQLNEHKLQRSVRVMAGAGNARRGGGRGGSEGRQGEESGLGRGSLSFHLLHPFPSPTLKNGDGENNDDFDYGVDGLDGSERMTTAAFLAAESLAGKVGEGVPWGLSDSLLSPVQVTNSSHGGSEFFLEANEVDAPSFQPHHAHTSVAWRGKSLSLDGWNDAHRRSGHPVPPETSLGLTPALAPSNSSFGAAPDWRPSTKLLSGSGALDTASSLCDGSLVEEQRRLQSQGSNKSAVTRDEGIMFGCERDGARGVVPEWSTSVAQSYKLPKDVNGGDARASGTESMLNQAAQTAPMTLATNAVHLVSPEVAKTPAVETVVHSMELGTNDCPNENKLCSSTMATPFSPGTEPSAASPAGWSASNLHEENHVLDLMKESNPSWRTTQPNGETLRSMSTTTGAATVSATMATPEIAITPMVAGATVLQSVGTERSTNGAELTGRAQLLQQQRLGSLSQPIVLNDRRCGDDGGGDTVEHSSTNSSNGGSGSPRCSMSPPQISAADGREGLVTLRGVGTAINSSPSLPEKTRSLNTATPSVIGNKHLYLSLSGLCGDEGMKIFTGNSGSASVTTGRAAVASANGEHFERNGVEEEATQIRRGVEYEFNASASVEPARAVQCQPPFGIPQGMAMPGIEEGDNVATFMLPNYSLSSTTFNVMLGTENI